MFKKVDTRQDFSKLEEDVLKFWEENDCFRKSIEIRKDAENFVFYDGPPFATGLPHYGHILAGTIKDVIPRYKTMRGFKVERRFGWDCHGLPVENLIEKELKLDDKNAIQEYGEANFCESCRDSVLRYTGEWEKTVTRMGRWVDFSNSYKTMDKNYMESIWWVFRQLWDKGLVYQGLKPMHVCPRCTTPLSNFEVTQGYKDLTDISVTAKFKINSKNCGGDDCGKIEFLAWTTTPWTLPGNVALAVNPVFDYAIMEKDGNKIVLADALIENFESELEGYEKIGIQKGQHFIDKQFSYEPLFKHYSKEKGAFRIVGADFVTLDSGTGIVHIAPAFGEDDLTLAKKEHLPKIQHVGMDGMFDEDLIQSILDDSFDFPNIPVKDAKDNRRFDENIIKYLESLDRVFKKENLRHSYPTCWRCDTPLLNYATKSWFIDVEAIKDKLIKNNKDIHWVPDHLKDGRFGKWLEGARDWAVSRTRYWGTPLPVWENDVTKQQVCIGSVEELEQLTGTKNITDIHKHLIDDLTFTKEGEEGVYKRIEEVFDCWFESGSMPYAQNHYPFNELGLKNEFYVSRHGEAEHNVNNVLSATIETSQLHPLTKKGVEATELESKNSDLKFDYIISSPFLRTQQTSEIFQKYCGGEIILDDGLVEHNVGCLDNKDFGEWVNWRKNCKTTPWEDCPETGENWTDVQTRMVEVLKKYNEKYEGKKILFVSHGCPSNLLVNFVKGIRVESSEGDGFPKNIPIKLEPNFKLPADFIAEGLDQTRGWFYTLHVLSTALFNKPAYQNVIVNGIVLAEDGQKMSKSKQNYPDPNIVFNKYGADAMRFYLMSSSVVAADDLRFSEHGVSEVLRNVIIPLWNSYSFFVTYANADNIDLSFIETENLKTSHHLDKWILSELELLKKNVTEEMDEYHINKATSKFTKFIDNLTNWYIRRSRRRFWSKNNVENKDEKLEAYSTLHYVLVEVSKLLAPFCPFISESMFQNLLETSESVHHQNWSKLNEKLIDTELSEKIKITQKVVKLGMKLRKTEKVKVRQPLQKIEIAMDSSINIDDQIDTIKEELNIKEVVFLDNQEEIAELRVKPNAKILGPRFGKKVQEIIIAAKSGNFETNPDGTFTVCNEILTNDEIEIAYVGKEGKKVASDSGIVVSMDFEITKNLKLEGQARDIVRTIQDMRKEVDYNVSDNIIIQIEGNEEVIAEFKDYIASETLGEFGVVENADLEKEGIKIQIKK